VGSDEKNWLAFFDPAPWLVAGGPVFFGKEKMGITFIDEWLIAEGASGRWYVIHTIGPRFIMEMCDEKNGGYSSAETMMIDECFDALLLAKLARLASEAFAKYDKELEDEKG